MRVVLLIGLAVLVVGGGIIAGCLDEVLDPDLDFEVLEANTNTTSPPPAPETAENGTHFLWVKVRVENQNENNDLTIAPGFFTVDDNADIEEEGEFLANDNARNIDSIRVDPGLSKDFWVIFRLPEDSQMEYIRYKGTLDEPVEKELPDY